MFRRRRHHRGHRRGSPPGPKSWFRACATGNEDVTDWETACDESVCKWGLLLADPLVLQLGLAVNTDQNVTIDTIRWPLSVNLSWSLGVSELVTMWNWWVVLRTGRPVNDFLNNAITLGTLLKEEDILDVRLFSSTRVAFQLVGGTDQVVSQTLPGTWSNPEGERPYAIKSKRKLDSSESIVALSGVWATIAPSTGQHILVTWASLLSVILHRSRTA